MPQPSYEERVVEIVQKDCRFSPDAYYFLTEALLFTQSELRGGIADAGSLLEGIRRLALQLFGPAARPTLNDWGIRSSQDIGEIVYNMVAGSLMTASPTDSREDFAVEFDFENAFPAPHLPKEFPIEMCRLLLDSEELSGLDRQFDNKGEIDMEWLARSRISPFISNSAPADYQVSDFHSMLEATLQAKEEGRFDDAVEAFRHFARAASVWENKPDMMMYDFLVQIEPYSPSFVAVLLAKIHLTPEPQPEFDSENGPPDLFNGRDTAQPRGFRIAINPDDLHKPEPDLTHLTGFGHAPPVSHEVHVYVNRTFMDQFEVSRVSREQEVVEQVLQRPRIAAILKSKDLKQITFVQKHYNVNACVEVTERASER